ncbi:MAG TPA: GNAT family N-acetyltransferase, partial [Candidatus Saccharimonadia bacterium]|nr:GNAT family N-acetyltransferase [Candidatus Saccharimonadia bacterium]
MTSRPQGSVEATAPSIIWVRGLPAQPGLIGRAYRGPSDHPGMAAANNAFRESIGVTELVTIEALDNLYANLSGSDPDRDCVVLERAGDILGYVRTSSIADAGGFHVEEVTVILDPAIRDEAMYAALLADGEGRLAAVRSDGTRRADDVLRAWTWDADTVADAVYRASGYRITHRFYEMVRPDLEAIPDVALPDGLEIRPVRPEHWRPIWEADIDAFSEDWDPNDASETGFQRFLGEPDQVPALWQVAWDGDQVAGHVLVTVNEAGNVRFGRREGVLDSVAVRRPYRRRGLARALIIRALMALRAHGETSAALGVDIDNPNQALDLYTSCGFVV